MNNYKKNLTDTKNILESVVLSMYKFNMSVEDIITDIKKHCIEEVSGDLIIKIKSAENELDIIRYIDESIYEIQDKIYDMETPNAKKNVNI